MLCLIFGPVPLWLSILLLAFAGVGLYYHLKKFALLAHPKSIVQFKLLDTNLALWELTNRRNEKVLAYLLGDSWWSGWLFILNFRTKDTSKRVSVLVCRDALEKNAFRKLSAYLNL